MVLRLLILLAVIAAPLEPVEAQYRGTRIVRVKRAKGPKWVQDPAAELAASSGPKRFSAASFPPSAKAADRSAQPPPASLRFGAGHVTLGYTVRIQRKVTPEYVTSSLFPGLCYGIVLRSRT